MVEPIFTSWIFSDYILPFVLVFTLIFAILEKTKLLGDGKRQVNAIIGLVVGLILITFPFANNIIVQLMPFLAVSAVVLLIFMLLYGFVWGKGKDSKGDVLHKGVKIALGIILGLGVVTMVLFATEWWNPVYDFLFNRAGAGQIWINVFMVVVVAVAIIVVLTTKDKDSKDE